MLCKVQVHDQVNGIVGGTAQTAMLRSSAFLEDRSRQLPAQARHVCLCYSCWSCGLSATVQHPRGADRYEVSHRGVNGAGFHMPYG